MQLRHLLFLVAGLVAALPGGSAPKASVAQPVAPWIAVEAPAVVTGRWLRPFPRGSHLVVINGASSQARPLREPFFAVRDPQVSFDGRRLLFSAQRAAGGRWQVWEAASDGTDPQQLTHIDGNALHPRFLPEGAVAFTEVSPRGSSQVAVLAKTGIVQAVTFGPGNYRLECVLRDGRLLVSAAWPLRAADRRAAATRRLYVLHPDGSGLRALRDITGGGGGGVAGEAAATASGAIVYRWQRAGRSGVLRELRPAAIRARSLGARTRRLLWPRSLAGEQILATRRIGSRYEPVHFNLRTHRVRAIFPGLSPADSIVQAVRLAPHSAPLIYPSILQWLNLPLYQAKKGQFVCLNSRLTMDLRHPAAPAAHVRVLGLSAAGPESLGQAPVAADGSFYIEVPADRPIRFELLDAADRLLRQQKSWIWIRPDEQRACVGCHESDALAPPNHWPLSLRPGGGPDVISGPAHAVPGAAKSRPVRLNSEQRRGRASRTPTKAAASAPSAEASPHRRGESRWQCSVQLCRRMPPLPSSAGSTRRSGAEQ